MHVVYKLSLLPRSCKIPTYRKQGHAPSVSVLDMMPEFWSRYSEHAANISRKLLQ